MEKLNYIIQELNRVNKYNKFVIEAVNERKKFYSNSLDKLENIPFEKIKNFSFISEALRKAEDLEKLNFAPKILDKVIKLETHQYSPELNKLHFKNHFVQVPQVTTIAEAITQIIKSNSITSLNKLYFEII